MKLLDPQSIRSNLNEQTRLDINNGIKLAKKVDSLKEKLLEEENKIELFKTETIKIVQKEIDNKIQEKDLLSREIIELKRKREELLKPLDEEWKQVNLEKQNILNELENIKRLKNQSDLSFKEIDNRLSKLKEEEERIENLKISIQNKIEDTNKHFEEAKVTLENAKQKSREIIEPLNQKEKQLNEKEESIRVYKQTLELREIEIQEQEKEIINEHKRLADQRGILERALARANIKL